MDEKEFPSNSRTRKPAKDEPKKVEKVVKGSVSRRKKPLGRRMAETFVGGDTRGVWDYVLHDVLLPAAKDMFLDALTQGAERKLFGESRSRARRGGRGGQFGYVSYNKMGAGHPAGRAGRPDERIVSRRGRATHNFDEIILDTRVEAEEVLERLFDLIAHYEQATVADLYELLGVESSYVDDKWGWDDIRGADVSRIRNGYLLNLPRPEPLD